MPGRVPSASKNVQHVADQLDVVGVDEIEERPRLQLSCRIAQCSRERRIHPLVVAVEAGDAAQVRGEIEQPLELGPRQLRARSRRPLHD
jgi:hypothetical protein